ncbi:unnamed protein product [Staurois parvus]|uniref:Uncharacterized protein n=1 Tax=Staurois parvus TaxID=386267 RepID=A0ABN9HRN9_9NEOB|nr:unnamed protein product [Staurois parvus]
MFRNTGVVRAGEGNGQAGWVRNNRADMAQRGRQSVVRRAGSGTIRQTKYQRSRLESGQE